MKIFGSKIEAVVTCAIAAFFVLVALAFTIEPLATLILSSRTLPAGTTVILQTGSKTVPSNIVNETAELIKELGFTQPDQAILAKISALAPSTPTHSRVALANSQKEPSYSIFFETPLRADDIVSALRQLLSRLSPSEIITLLPDNTTMIETVIDPGLVPVIHEKNTPIEHWTFANIYPQIDIQQKHQGSAILINNPQVVDNHGFETPLSCRRTQTGIRQVDLDPQRRGLVSSIFIGFLAYLRDFNCFQSFSTFIQK